MIKTNGILLKQVLVGYILISIIILSVFASITPGLAEGLEETAIDNSFELVSQNGLNILYRLFNPLMGTASELANIANDSSNTLDITNSTLNTSTNSTPAPTPTSTLAPTLTPTSIPTLTPEPVFNSSEETSSNNPQTTSPKKTHVTGNVKDHENQPVSTNIYVTGHDNRNRMIHTSSQNFNLELEEGDNVVFDAGTKGVTARFKIKGNSSNSIITLDNFGKAKPAITGTPQFNSMKFVEVHADNTDYETVTITISYSEDELSGFDEGLLTIYHYTGGQWIPTISHVDRASNTITATVNSLSYFAVGQGSGINIFARFDSTVNPDDTITVSGGVYYDNLTTVPDADINITIQTTAISTDITTDSLGNFKATLPPPASTGSYNLKINAVKGAMDANTTSNLQVTSTPLFRITGTMQIDNEDVVASDANITISSELPAQSVSDSAQLTLTGTTSVTGTKIYNLFTDTKVDDGINATGTYTFLVDSLTSGEVTKNWASIYLYAISYTGLSVAEESYDTYLDGTYKDSSSFVKPWDQSTWYWNNSLATGDILYNTTQTVDVVTPNPSTLVRFNLTGDMHINFTSSGLSKPSNSKLYADNVLLLSTTGDLTTENINLTGFLGDSNDLIVTSDTKGGISYALTSQFHKYMNASVVDDGVNYTVTLTATNNNSESWYSPAFGYTVPQGAGNFVIIDKDNNELNVTSSCTLPSDGGEVDIPASVIGEIKSGIIRTFTLSYSLKQLDVTPHPFADTYMPGQTVDIYTDVLYNGSVVSDATVTITIKDPLDVTVFNGPATWNGNNYSITKTTNDTWLIGVYHVNAGASKTVGNVLRSGTNSTSFVEKRLILYVQANGPYPPLRNITLSGRAYYSDESAEGGKTVNISVGGINTTATTNATGYFQTIVPGMDAGTYQLTANITNGYGLTDSDNDTVLVLATPFFILIDTELSETSGQALLEPDHNFTVEVPSSMDVLSSTITLTGITQKTEEYDISPPPISMLNIGTTQFDFVNGTFTVTVPPYKSVTVNAVDMTVTAFPQGSGVQESVFNNSIDGIDVGESRYVVPDTPSSHTWTDDITARVTPGIAHDVRITKLDTFTIDYKFLVMMHVNRTGYLDTPLNPRAYVVGNIIYAEPGDMLTNSHTTDITKFLEAGSNSVNFVNDRNALVNYIIQVRVRDWNYTQETIAEIPSRFEIENVLYAAATDQKLMNPEVRHPLKRLASNLTVYDIDNNTDITASCTVADNELFIPTNLIGPINAGDTRLFNVSYDAPRPNISPSLNTSVCNHNDTILISVDIEFYGVPMTDANVSVTIANNTNTTWQGTLTHTGSGTYTVLYQIPANATLGIYNVTVSAYNESTNMDDEVVSYQLSQLTITPFTIGPFVTGNGGNINGNVNDSRTDAPINSATVEITISNQSGIVNQTEVYSNVAGYFSFVWDATMAGDYLLTITANDSDLTIGTLEQPIAVEYDVVLVPNRTDYNVNYTATLNVSVHDLGSIDVPGANVSVLIDIPAAGNETLSTGNGRLSYLGGVYTGTFNTTANMGTYNYTVNLSNVTANGTITGNDVGSFRVSDLHITEMSDKLVYIVDENVTVWGSVEDLETGLFVENGTYNISLFNSSGFVTSRSGSILTVPDTIGAALYDEDTFEVAGDDWNSRNNEDPVRDSSTAYAGSWSLHMTWPGTTAWGGRNFEGTNNLEAGQTSSGYSTTDYPYMSMAYRISPDDKINMLILVNGAWRSLDVTQGINTTGSYPTVANWGSVNSDDQWHWTEIDLDGQLDASMGIGNHQITGIIWYPNSAIDGYLTGDFWIDDFRISNNSIATSYEETFSGLPADPYTAMVDISYLTLVGANSSDFTINYNVNSSIPSPLYSVGRDVNINISVFDTGSIPVTGANLTVNITNSTGLVKSISGSNITDNNNGYYNTTYITEIEGDFNISVHVEKGSAVGDAPVLPFRVTQFYVDVAPEFQWYEVGDNVTSTTLTGRLWDLQGAPKWANVTIQVFGPVGTLIQNITLTNQYDNFTHSFYLGSTNNSGTYSIQVNASEIESGGNLAASNTSSFNVEYFVDSATNRSQYNTDDTVNVTLNIKNSTTNINSASVDVNVTYIGPSDWWNASYWNFDREYRVGISTVNTYNRSREDTYIVVRGSDLASAGVSLTNLPINSTRVIAYSTQENLSSRNEVARVVSDINGDGYLNTSDEIIFLANFSASESKNYWLYYDYGYDITASPEYTIPLKLQLYLAEEFIITSDYYARVYYKHSNRDGTFGGYVQIDDNNYYARGAVIADFDNDGDYDVVSGDRYNLFFHEWTDVGTFTKTSVTPTFSASNYLMDMATADFDEDGNMDFIVGGNNDDLYLYEGDGMGDFTKITITTNAPGTAGRGKDAGDVNEDGHMDFVYAENPTGKVYAYYGNGAGTFAAPVELVTLPDTDPYGVALGDFDNDGHLDIIANGGAGGAYHIYSGDGTGIFVDEGMKFDVNRLGGVDAFDYDHDGNLDVIHTTYDTEYTYYRAGNGNFGFGSLSLGVNGYNVMGISAPPMQDIMIPSIGIKQNLSHTQVGSSLATGLGNGNYNAEFTLSDAQLGIYLVETDVTSPWPGDDAVTFFVRSLDEVNNTYGPHNFNGTHQSPILPVIISGTIRDSEFNNTLNNAYANITIRYPNNTVAAYQSITTDANGIFNHDFTSQFNSNSPAGTYNVSILVNDGGIIQLIETYLTVSDVYSSWADPAKDYRVAIILNNSANSTPVTYNERGFVLELPGSVAQSSVAITDINGNAVGNSLIWDNANTINVTLDNFSLGMFEGGLVYIYFDRDAQLPPDNTSLTSSICPLIEGAIEGYWMVITNDLAIYNPSTTAQITANLTLANGTQLTGSTVNFSVYYPDMALAYGPHNIVSDPANISVSGNSNTLSYSIPNLKGIYTVVVNATSPNGIPRTEISTFNVGGLGVTADTDRSYYNTRDDVWLTVDVTDLGVPVNNALVTVDFNDPSGLLPYEYNEINSTNSDGIAIIHWPMISPDSPVGNYSITVNANTANDSGYNGSQTIEIDNYVTTLDLNDNLVSLTNPVTASGSTTHNGSEIPSWVNISVTYQSAFIDDTVPYGASTGNQWIWDYNNVHSGSYSHLQEVQGPASVQHIFYDAYSGYRAGSGENISVWVYVDSIPETVDEIMVQFHANDSWNHRAYWGVDNIPLGTNNTTSRQYIGPLPAAGTWYELVLTSSQVGLDGLVVDGMAFAVNETSSNVARVWFDEVTFEFANTHDSYLENQNVSTPYSYVISNTFTEGFNDTFTTFNSTEWDNSSTSIHNISAEWMELNGNGLDFNANFSGSTTYSRTAYPVLTADFMTDNLSGGLVVAVEGNPTSGYRRHGIYIDKADGILKTQTYDLDGWHYENLFTPEIGKWYTMEVRFYATESQLFVYSRDDSSRPMPDKADSTYNLTDWNPNFHFWTFDNTGYIDNAAVTTRSNTSALPWVGDYIVTGLSSYSNLYTVNVSTILVSNLNITVNTGDSYDLTIGNPELNNVTINGTVQDNRSGVPRPSPVLVYVTAPDGLISVYNLQTDVNGSFTVSFTRPSLIGTYDVTVTAKDTAGTTGRTDTSFDIQIGSTIAPTIETINLMDTAILTVELFDDVIFDDMEQVTSNWSYRAGTTGTVRNMSEEVHDRTRLYHKSGTQSQKVDYYVTKSTNEYMYLESGLGPIDVSQVNNITFWLYLDLVDAFDAVALVLENDATGTSSDERIYGQNPVPGWNYYSFNVSDFGMDLTHAHYLTVLIDDDNSASEVETRGSVYIDDFKVINGNSITGASVSINITKPGMSVLSYSTPADITDLGNGRYSLDFAGTDEYGNYNISAISTSDGYTSTATTQFIVDRLNVSPVLLETPYIVGDTGNFSVSVHSNMSTPFDGTVSLNLTLPNGTSVNYNTSAFSQSTENYARTGTAGGSGFGSVTRINDGSFVYPATTAACIGDYAQITWAQPVTINQVMVYYDTNKWPTSYRIQVLDTDGVTWVDKKVVNGFTTTSFPYVIDDIPTSTTKGVRISYETSNNAQNIYIFEMWVYNTAATFTPLLPISGDYTAQFTALDSKDVSGTTSITVPVNFNVETVFDKLSYDPGDNATVSISVFNGTHYVPGVSVSSQLSYIGNGSLIASNSTTTDSNGTVDVMYQIPEDYSSYYINSSVAHNGITGLDSEVTTSAHLKMWIDPAEVLVGHPSWNADLTPEEYRDISIHAEFLTKAGHILDDQTITANIYKYDGTLVTSLPLTGVDGLYTADYTIAGNSPEGTYWVELDKYPGINEYFSVMEWGCTRCHINPGMDYNHYYAHAITSGAYGNSDGPVSPSNFSKEYVHEVHPLVDPAPAGTGGSNCGYHNNARDVNCVKCHLTEVLPSACPDCHNSGQDKWSNVLSEDYGADVHAGINVDTAKNKIANSSHGGNPSFAVDSNDDTYWSPDGVTNQIMEIDLDGAYYVDGVRIAMSNYKSTYTVQGLNNGSWITLISSTTYSNYDNEQLYTFSSQNISRVRFTVSSWSRVWTGTGYCSSPTHTAAVLTEQPKLKSLNVYLPNNVSLTLLNPDTHDSCQVCHGGDISNDIQPTIPDCTDCHPESSGSGMQVMPDNMSTVSRELEDYEDVSDIIAYTAPGFPVSTVSLTASTDQAVEGTKSGKLDYSMALGVGRIYIDQSDLEFTNATSIKFWLYGNPADDNTQFQVSIRNNKSGKWHYNTAQHLNWSGWKEVEIPITSLSELEILYISHADMLRIQLENYDSDSGTIYIDDLHVERKGTHTQYQEIECGTCHESVHNTQYSYDCENCHQTQTHGNMTASEPTCVNVDCHHYMENGSLIVRNSTNETTLVEIPMDGAKISECGVCHSLAEPHDKQWNYVCMDCHRDSEHGQVDESYTDYEKASTCLKCHNDPHDLQNELSAKGGCNGCHQHRIHGQNSLTTPYNESIHLDCLRCHGNPVNDSEPIPIGLGHPGEIHITQTYGLTAAECMFCHENATNSYELHTGLNVDLADTTLVESIENESVCIICHDPVPLFSNTSLEARDDLLLEPHATQVAGHGNVSCFVCHGHSPAQLTLNFGADCVGCHINEAVAPVNSTNGTDIPPTQVLGHGNTECSECHGHTNSQLTFVGETAEECMACHENASAEVKLLEYEDPVSNGTVPLSQSGNVWTVTPPQVVGHGNVTCLECHTHAPSDFVNVEDFLGPDCTACHMNESRNVSLINDTIPKNSNTVVVDNSNSTWVVTSPIVLGHGNASCAECHGHTNSNLTFLGSTISSCIDCHENSSRESLLLDDTIPESDTTTIINDTVNPKIVNPPQVDGHGNVSCFVCHDHAPSDFSNTTSYELIGGNCSSCHKNASTITPLINNTIPTHIKTNWTNYPVDTPPLVTPPQVVGHGRDNEVDCFVCHGHTNSRLSIPGTCTECHENQTMYNELNTTYGYEPPQVAGHGNASCDDCHGHDTPDLTFKGSVDEDCLDCHINASTDSINNTWTLLNNTIPQSDNTVVVNNSGSQWIVNPPQVAGHGNTSCIYCHGHAPAEYYIDTATIIGTDCYSCHINASAQPIPLQNNTIPDSGLTNWTNSPNQTPAMVIAPQVLAHGNDTNHDGVANSSDCYECHGHTNSDLTFISDCYLCHSGRQHGSSDNPMTGQKGLQCWACHTHDNMNKTYLGLNSPEECNICHLNVTQANVINETYSLYPPQIFGHQDRHNSSAYLNCDYCHEHVPSAIKKLTARGWEESECRDCHVEGSNKTVTWTPPTPINEVPADWGHAQMHCKDCHGHTPSGMDYVGIEQCADCHVTVHSDMEGYDTGDNSSWDDACYVCHIDVNSTNKTDLIRFDSAHNGDSNCTVCHVEPNGTLELIPDWSTNYKCKVCHTGSNPDTNNTLIENSTWYASQIAVNASDTHGNSTYMVQCTSCHSSHRRADTSNDYNCTTQCHVAQANTSTLCESTCHTDGVTEVVEDCEYCHNNVAPPEPTVQITDMHTSSFQSNNTTSHHNCTWCHYQLNNYTPTIKSVNGTDIPIYPNIHNIYVPTTCNECHPTAIPTHPILGNNYDSMTLDGCLGCHGTAHSIIREGGGPDCLSSTCHSNNTKPVNITEFEAGPHSTMNSGATNTSPMSYESEKACWLCHGNGSEPSTHLTNMSNVRSCDDETYCHGNMSSTLNITSHSPSADNKYVKTSSSITCEFCHNRTGIQVYNQSDTSKSQVTNMSNMPAGSRVTAHYIKDLTDTSSDDHSVIDTVGWAGGSQGCVYCHRTSSGAVFNATNISQLSGHDPMGNNCYGCHIVGTTTLHDIGVINASDGGPDCVVCHGTGAPLADVNTTIFNTSIHATLNSGAVNTTPVNILSKACWACHGNGTEPSGHPNQTVSVSNPANVTYPLNCTEAKCHVNGTPAGITISGTQPGITLQHIPDVNYTSTIWTDYQAGNADSCTYCHNKSITNHTEPEFGAANETDHSNVSHYGSRTDLVTPTTNCDLCHKNATTGLEWGNATQGLRHPVNKSVDFCGNCHGSGDTFHTPNMSYAADIHTIGFDWEGDNADYITGQGQQYQDLEGCYACHEEGDVMSSVTDANTKTCEECHYNNSAGPFNTVNINMRSDIDSILPRVFNHVNDSVNASVVITTNMTATSLSELGSPSTCFNYNNNTGEGACHGVSYDKRTAAGGYYAFNNSWIPYDVYDNNMSPYRWTQTIDRLPNTTDCRICHLGANGSVGTLMESAYWGTPMNVSNTKPGISTHTKSTALASDCWGCHVVGGGQPFDFHDMNLTAGGGPDCIACHDVDGPVSAGNKLNVTSMNVTSSIHDTLNNATLNGTNYMCYACHLDGQPPASGHPINLSQTKQCSDCHTGATLYGAPLAGRHIPNASGAQFRSTSNVTTQYAECWDCHNNSVNASATLYQSNKSRVSHYGTYSNLVETNSNTSVDLCYNCHDNTTTAANYGNATQVVMAVQTNCYTCHNGDWNIQRRGRTMLWVFSYNEPGVFHNTNMGTYWACSTCH